jgi:hypothetical protein
MKRFLHKLLNKNYLLLIPVIFLFYTCKQDNTLAPYSGSPAMSNIMVEENTYNPKITWVGGYATVVGINKGSNASLDSSLVWLVYKEGDAIHYPITYDQLPEGASDLTSQYGGTHISKLVEDQPYTYWVMKEDMWKQVSSKNNKVFRVNDSLQSGFTVDADTLYLSKTAFFTVNKNIDKYLNITEVSYFGSPDIILGHIEVIQTDTSYTPIIKWTITQLGVTDSLIAAIGIVEGTAYDPTKVVWEVYSEDTINDKVVYGKTNVISSPVYPPQFNNPHTYTFTVYPSTELQRNSGYYVWIAAKQWDQKSRLRITPYYAFITFKTS